MTACAELRELSPAECRTLLHGHAARVGRVAVAGPRPLILPVNYVLDGSDIVFGTVPGSRLAAAVDGEFVAFEVDDLDARARAGWSVLLRGKAETVTDPGERARLRGLGLSSWAPDRRDCFVRIRPGHVTGRRIVA